jgi:hypothetical protein
MIPVSWIVALLLFYNSFVYLPIKAVMHFELFIWNFTNFVVPVVFSIAIFVRLQERNEDMQAIAKLFCGIVALVASYLLPYFYMDLFYRISGDIAFKSSNVWTRWLLCGLMCLFGVLVGVSNNLWKSRR